MGLLPKQKNSQPEETLNLSSEELNFLLQKMRSATYLGSEFETFYTVWTKLTDQLNRNSK